MHLCNALWPLPGQSLALVGKRRRHPITFASPTTKQPPGATAKSYHKVVEIDNNN
jgi:hypothetical protein